MTDQPPLFEVPSAPTPRASVPPLAGSPEARRAYAAADAVRPFLAAGINALDVAVLVLQAADDAHD